jgi:inorganic pyrophosphatase
MHPPNLVHDLPPFDDQRNLRVVVETPRGANIKLKYDDRHGCFSLTRIMPLGVVYPYDFGFIPQTLAQDGDPLDVLVLIDAATYPGVVIPSRLIGALQIEERGMRGRPNHRLVAVPIKAARKDDLRDLSGLGERVQRELERFFIVATAFTAKDPQIRGWVGPEAASDMVHKAIQRYRDRRRPHHGQHFHPSAASPTPAVATTAATTAPAPPPSETPSIPSLEDPPPGVTAAAGDPQQKE